MKRFGMLRTAVCAGVVVFASACSSSDSIEPRSSEATTLSIRLTDPPPTNNGFESPRDTVNVEASVLDGRGNGVDGGSVEWILKLENGQPVGTSIASLSSTGPRTARIIFRSEVTVGINASFARSDGTMVSKTIYMLFSR